MIPEYIEADLTTDPLILLEKFYSKSEIKHLKKQNAIKFAKKSDEELWIKVGKNIYIFVKSWHFLAQQAQVWWEYHFQLMPKALTWKSYEENKMQTLPERNSS